MSAVRLAIVNTHPIQYYSPLFRRLSESEAVDVHVFYGWKGGVEEAYDPGFEQDVTWDIPLLEGYPYTFLENTSSDPGTHHFRGIIAPNLIPAIEEWGADALLVFGWSFQSHLAVLRHFHGRIPILFRGDSTLLSEQPGVRKILRRMFLYWVYRHIDRALYVGEHNRAYFEAHGLDESQLTWVPHAVENRRFYDQDGTYEMKAQKWKREIGIPQGAPVALFAGKIGETKAPDVLLEAFCKTGVPDAHLVMVGSGPEEGYLRSKYETREQIHFLGFQNQSKMPVVYRLADVFVLPSRGETWGLAINEAMACSRPVIASTSVGGAVDLVDEENGAVVPPDDPSALCDALDDFLQDREKCRKMGRHSRERIADWSIDVAASRTVSAIRATVS